MRTISLHVLTALAVLAPTAWKGGRHIDGSPAVTVANLRDQGVTHSGFVVGTTTAGTNAIALVEVSLDSGAYQPATGTTTWKFKLPTGTATWKDNSAHTVDVRVTDSGANVTTSSTLSVRKGNNLDVNGDGFADVLVGGPAFDNNRGRVYLFYSSSNGSGIPSSADANNLDDPRVKVIGGAFDGPQSFGASTAMADVNGDGFADLIVGAPTSSNGAGHLYVIYALEVAPGSALVVVGNATGTSTQILGDSNRRLGLGTSVAAGDVNGDGFADVISGAPGTAGTPSGEAGRAYVFLAQHSGNVVGINAATVFTADNTIVGETAGTNFGISVATGDVNGDTFADVVAGANLFGGTQGKVYVFNGATNGTGIAATSAANANTHIIGEQTSQLGTSLAVGDLNGDGFPDVVAGGPTFGGNRGRVYMFYSAGQDGVPTNPTIDENNTTDGQHVIGGEFGVGDQLFGASVAVGDLNDDGALDLIVGAPAAFDGAGKVYTFHSDFYVGPTQGNAVNRTSQIIGDGYELTSAAFGTSVSAGDVNGDGIMDVIAGASGTTTKAGRAFIFHATAAGEGTVGGVLRGDDGTIFVFDATTTIIGAAGSFFAVSIAR